MMRMIDNSFIVLGREMINKKGFKESRVQGPQAE